MKKKLVAAGAVVTALIMVGCSSNGSSEDGNSAVTNVGTATPAAEQEDAIAADEVGASVPAELLQACFAARNWTYNGRYEVFSAHTPISAIAEALGATWEEDAGGGWIMRATKFDQLSGATNELAAKVNYGNDLSDVPATCGPKVVAVTRVVVNGGELTPQQADQLMVQAAFRSEQHGSNSRTQSGPAEAASTSDCFTRPYSFAEAQEYEAAHGRPPEGEVEVCS